MYAVISRGKNIAIPPNREVVFLWKVCGEILTFVNQLFWNFLFKNHKRKQNNSDNGKTSVIMNNLPLNL